MAVFTAKKKDFIRLIAVMFDNFIYYIVVLLIYSTFQPSEETNFAPMDTVVLFLGLAGVFAWVTWMQFRRIERRIPQNDFSLLDHKFSTAMTRQSVMAIGVFAVNIYGLKLTSFFGNIAIFSWIPTLQALVFLGLFVAYLSVVWACSYPAYRKLYPTDLSKGSYIASKISISVPVLLPWLLLSITVDIIHILPFDLPRRYLATTEGQVIYFLVFLVGVAIFGPAMIQKFWRCRPLEPGSARERIEGLCRRAGVKYANILYWPIFGGRMLTAGVMGLIRRFRYILVTGGLFRLLEPDEVDAVIAHEIGHVKKRHLLFYLFFFIGYLLISFATFDLILFGILYSKPLYRLIESGQADQVFVTSVMTSLLMIVIFLFYFRFVFGFFMRNFERQADIYVYELLGSARPLIRTLEKIALSSGQPADKPNWHHFSISQRVAYLWKCEKDRTWITRHERKIRRSIAAYLAGIMVIGGAGYHLSFGETGRKINAHFLEKIILRELEKKPADDHLLSILGDLYYSRKNYAETIAAYGRALDSNPRNPRVLNNLAWLLATCEEARFRNPGDAVALAERAVRLSPAPHILDTLAESYFAAGRYADAILIESRLLKNDPKNRSYYLKQLKKFKDTAGMQ